MYPPGVYFEFIGKAWSMVQSSMGPWIINSIVFMIVAAVGSMINQLLGNVLNPMDPVAIQSAGLAGLGPYYAKSMLISLPFSFLYTGAFNGMMLSALDQVQGRPVSVRIFEGFKNFPMLFATSILSYLISYVSMAACCIPALIIPPLFAYAPFFSAMEGLSPVDALKKSLSITKPFWLSFAGIYILAALVSGLGIIALCVGILFTLPIFPIVMALQLQALAPAGSSAPTTVGPQPPSGPTMG